MLLIAQWSHCVLPQMAADNSDRRGYKDRVSGAPDHTIGGRAF